MGRYLCVVGILASIVAAAFLGTSPAYADPNTYFLECLNQRGDQITDTAKALALGQRIQNDEFNGVAPEQIILNLERNWGQPRDLAYDEMNCVAQATVHG